jgi:hypothetical protein
MKTNTNKNQKQNSEAQSRPEQLSTSTGNRPKINLELRRANRALDTEKLLALLRSQTPRFFELAEVVGKWVWIQFTEKQPAEEKSPQFWPSLAFIGTMPGRFGSTLAARFRLNP